MNQYLELDFSVSPPDPWSEILMAELIDLNFDSFQEKEDGILAYVEVKEFDEAHLQKLWLFDSDEVKISYTLHEVPNINWNSEWEKNFSPILVEDKVLIRAEFHPAQEVETEIIIQPKMAFGTGHHATTYLMIQQMLKMDFHCKKVLDMGCGTSVLGIFALKRGAQEVLAIDIDEWAVENSEENAERNNVSFTVKQGTAEDLGNENFDVILANINRNILLADIPKYVAVLHEEGQLLLSGLCDFDEEDILKVCTKENLALQNRIQKEEWVSLLLKK